MFDVSLTENESRRYERNLRIPGFGEAGQLRLKSARVLVVGLGGLGGPASFYLAAAGVGTLGLMDGDVVELSNLQRQILHSTERLGMEKARSAMMTLNALNPDVHLNELPFRLTPENAPETLSGYDAVVEATDSYAAKLMINDICLTAGVPLITAGVQGINGHAMLVIPGKTACLRCVLPSAPENAPLPADEGVLGAVAGMMGALMATELITWLAGLRTVDTGFGLLHGFDGRRMRQTTLRVPRNPECGCLKATCRE